MKITAVTFLILVALCATALHVEAAENYPVGRPGLTLRFVAADQTIPDSNVQAVHLTAGALADVDGIPAQWMQLSAVKANQDRFSVLLLVGRYPADTAQQAQVDVLRYILVLKDGTAVEFMDQATAAAILPNTGAWAYLLPRTASGDSPFASPVDSVRYLGRVYTLDSTTQDAVPGLPSAMQTVALTPDLLIGVPHNKKVKNETRRWDESDYEYVAFTRENYAEMIAHGLNVLNVNAEQLPWIQTEGVYYWGIGGKDIAYPEDLYRSNYIGPAMFFDEPMVHTRDQALRPKFKKDPSLRKQVTPQMFFKEFQHEYHMAKYERSPVQLIQGLKQRDDVDLGDMDFLQQNIYSWETMVSSALYQLSEGDPTTPSAIVFEPPGRLGARRVLPELNACFDCQIPADDPKNMIGIIKGFIRGAARQTGKEWGISIYGQVVRSEAYWYMTHAYEQGATRFFYWDSYQLAAVPYGEYLSLSQNLRNHAKNFPRPFLEQLKHSAEVAIVLPVGYNLGHVKMGIGNLGGLPELNMERKNAQGIQYRDMMSNFYIEIERYIRLGVEYDLYWELDGLNLDGYREVVTIREDGRVGVTTNGETRLLDGARIPERPQGEAPKVAVAIKQNAASIKAVASVEPGSAPVYYTQGANAEGVYRNTYVLWELYGPEEEDYTDFWNDRWDVAVTENADSAVVEHQFTLEKPGTYRLRVSASDMAGRSTVVWKAITIAQ